MEETHPEAAEILRAAGWTPHDTWGVFTRDTLVMGSPRAGDFHVKNIARCPDSPDTPDDPVEAARWLVARFPVAEVSEPEETPAHEAHEETGAETQHASVDNDDGDDGSGLSEEEGPASTDYAQSRGYISSSADWVGGSFEPGSNVLDADFYEPNAPAIEGADLGAEILDEGQGGSAFIFGDNLAQLRTSAIGLVVQISLAKQEAIWAEAGAGPDEYSQLTSAVVRDTVDGLYRGDQATYDRFVALSGFDHAARNVQAAERAKVTALTAATRAEIESFDPEAGWPA